MKKFIDVARFYIGCKVYVKSKNKGEFIADFSGLEPMCGNFFKMLKLTNSENVIVEDDCANFCICKPILKKLSSIDEKTMEEIYYTSSRIEFTNNDSNLKYKFEINPICFDILTRNGYDLFELIENGEAIDFNSNCPEIKLPEATIIAIEQDTERAKISFKKYEKYIINGKLLTHDEILQMKHDKNNKND